MTIKLTIEKDADTYLLCVDIRLRYDSLDESLVILQKIGEIFSRVPEMAVPLTPEISERISKIIRDHREENLARSTIPGDELKMPEDTEVEVSCTSLEQTNPVKIKAPIQPKKRHGRDKWQIPFVYKENPREYDKAWKLCKKFNLPYPEAVKKRDEAYAAKGKKPSVGSDYNPGKQVTCSYCGYECNSHALHLHVLHKHPEKYEEHKANPDRLGKGIHKEIPAAGRIESDIKIEGMDDDLIKAMPETRPPSGLQEKRLAAVDLKRGDHVRQIKKFNDRQVSGIGIVSGIKNGLIEVNFNGTQYYKIARDCLEVV